MNLTKVRQDIIHRSTFNAKVVQMAARKAAETPKRSRVHS